MMSATEIGPLVKELSIAIPLAEAWRVFTESIDEWWPAATHSVGHERVASVVLEGRPGGKFFERWDDGTEHVWGEVEVWEPPSRLRYAWHPGRDASQATEVEIWFDEEDGGTRFRLEHRNWERLGSEATETRANYDTGWDFVLGQYPVTT